MDNLKKHIKQHRAELDEIEAPNMGKIWSGIQGELQEDGANKRMDASQLKVASTKFSSRFTLWAMATAASVALLIGVGIGYLATPKTAVINEFNLADYAPAAAEQATNYQQLVADKKVAINFQNIDTLAFSEVLQELKAVDEEYEHWTKEVPQYVREQELLEFLQRHYEQKIRILEILSKEIEKKVHHEERTIRL